MSMISATYGGDYWPNTSLLRSHAFRWINYRSEWQRSLVNQRDPVPDEVHWAPIKRGVILALIAGKKQSGNSLWWLKVLDGGCRVSSNYYCVILCLAFFFSLFSFLFSCFCFKYLISVVNCLVNVGHCAVRRHVESTSIKRSILHFILIGKFSKNFQMLTKSLRKPDIFFVIVDCWIW